MLRIFLIACAAKKKPTACPADRLYDSPLFQKSLAYARRKAADKIYILSAKHGLLKTQAKIAPYNLTLNQMPLHARRKWANKVAIQLQNETNLQEDLFTFLAGQKYRENLEPLMAHVETPLAGMPIGKQLQWLGSN
ncbi:MAG: hypothetical protein GDA55_07970 [Cellvibrionales bacterium]|nr:hypothetical protein [Cellvibrionales bacterium]